MPFFGNKFSPKKTPTRKKDANTSKESIEQFMLNQRKLQLKLDDQQYVFNSGHWITESGRTGAVNKKDQKLRKQLETLQEENNLLYLKLEILLNMLTQITAEGHIHQREIRKMRKL